MTGKDMEGALRAALAAALGASLLGGCTSWPGETISDDYGRATEHNKGVHIIEPVLAGDTEIPGDGARAAAAVAAYKAGEQGEGGGAQGE